MFHLQTQLALEHRHSLSTSATRILIWRFFFSPLDHCNSSLLPVLLFHTPGTDRGTYQVCPSGICPSAHLFLSQNLQWFPLCYKIVLNLLQWEIMPHDHSPPSSTEEFPQSPVKCCKPGCLLHSIFSACIIPLLSQVCLFMPSPPSGTVTGPCDLAYS